MGGLGGVMGAMASGVWDQLFFLPHIDAAMACLEDD